MDFPPVQAKVRFRKREENSPGFLEKPLSFNTVTQDLKLPKNDNLTLFPLPEEKDLSQELSSEAYKPVKKSQDTELKIESFSHVQTNDSEINTLSSHIFKH